MQGDAVLSSWIPAYDARYARYSPGLVLHIEMAKHAASIGIKRIDLGRGYNDMKAGLMSASIPVAVGCIERRPLQRALSAGWFCARNLVHATPLRGAPLRFYRRLKNRFIKA
jgi:CelD/BcsL family acetyltransferase involved in cellulose biosynthesis